MKTAVVTGAGSGVGRFVAVALAERGWNVTLVGHGSQSLQQTAELIDNSERTLVQTLDVADAKAIDAAGDATVSRFGTIDAWVNSAAVGIFGPFMAATHEDIDRVMAVSVNGVINGSRAAARQMTKGDGGVVVNVGSSLAFTSVPHNIPYAASKAAVRSFSMGLAQELRGTNVTVALAHLPAIATPWFAKVKTLTKWQSRPVGTMHDPKLVGQAVADLVEHPRAGDCYLGLSTVVVVAGARLAPRLTAWVSKHAGERLQQTKFPAPTADNLWSAVEPPPETPSNFRTTHHAPRWWPALGSAVVQRRLARLGKPTSRRQGGQIGERPSERFDPTDQ